MTNTVEPTVDWSQDQMVEVLLNEPDDFLKVRETLTASPPQSFDNTIFTLEVSPGLKRLSPSVSAR